MLVWIPRYAYKITSKVHQGGTDAGDIEIAFVNTTNKDKAGTSYSTTYPTVENNLMTDYVVHPAFVNYDGKELSGIWVGKYESSNDGSNNVKIVSGVSSWRSISVNDIYNKCISMKNSGNQYGLTENSDPHMLKNTEWGAVAYLTQSKMGKQADVSINSSSSFITGTGGVAASTTGNETGIYDMSGGAYEYTAAYVDVGSSSSYLTSSSYGKALYEAPTKHKDVYKAGTPEGQESNYNVNSDKYGDGVWETSNAYNTSNGSWYNDYSNFPDSIYPFFHRGGYCYKAGLFSFSNYGGSSYNEHSFRVCIVVL